MSSPVIVSSRICAVVTALGAISAVPIDPSATFSEVTGVDRTTPSIQNTYNGMIDALPVAPDLRQFTSATEVNIMKLGLEYCNALVYDTTARAAYFPGFPFGDPAAFDSASIMPL